MDLGGSAAVADHESMGGVLIMTDREFAEYLRSMPRELTEEQVREKALLHDYLTGLWVGNQVDHHEAGEARH